MKFSNTRCEVARPGAESFVQKKRATPPCGRRAALARVLAAVLGVTAWAAPPATAHFDKTPEALWSYRQSTGCTQKADPVTVVFYGSTATGPATENHVGFQTGWPGDGQSNDVQTFKNHGDCGYSQFGRADGYNVTRFHIRGRQAVERDLEARWETYTTPHYEIWNGSCGSLGNHYIPNGSPSGFDKGRARIVSLFSGSHHHYADYYNIGNTQGVAQQCNGGRSAASNGDWAWFAINGGLH
jgi:hypothetical protein